MSHLVGLLQHKRFSTSARLWTVRFCRVLIGMLVVFVLARRWGSHRSLGLASGGGLLTGLHLCTKS